MVKKVKEKLEKKYKTIKRDFDPSKFRAPQRIRTVRKKKLTTIGGLDNFIIN
jgi:hypothetical protein